MKKLPVVTAKEVISSLTKHGFIKTGQRGSHVKLRNNKTGQRVIILYSYFGWTLNEKLLPQ